MNRLELVERIAAIADSNLSKSEIDAILLCSLKAIQDAVAEGKSVTLIGFGTFKAIDSAERTGRNPATGKAIKIPAQRKVKFLPGAAFKNYLNR